MAYRCPACARPFAEAGFCPFDGKPLAAAPEQATVLSSYVRAQSENEVRAMSAAERASGVIAAMKEHVETYDRLVGETLDGRYLVQRKLGEGGMGVVFAARHAVIERPLAIKVLKREATREVATIQRFIQEAKAASRIGHPNIVDITDFGTTPDGLTYSVMEFVDGPTLAKVIKESSPLGIERAVRIASQIARALGAAHDKGVIHRDLKPENVFLIDRDGRPDFVKIVDFGIAKVTPVDGAEVGPKLTRAGAVFGTPEYMAPEQAAGRSDTDRRVDIYALGTILYEMLVGSVPHRSGSLMKTIAMQMLDPITPPSQARPDLAIPPALEAAVMKSLAKKREERYQTMAEVLADLEALDTSVPPTAPAPPGRSRPPTKPLHEPEFVAGPLTLPIFESQERPVAPVRRRWPIAVFALLAAVVALAVIARRWDRGDDTAATAPRDAPARDTHQIALVEDAGPAQDAAVAVIHDAGVRVPRMRDGGLLTHPETITIEVLIDPGDAQLYIDGHQRGPAGTHVTERWGRRVTIECKAPHLYGRTIAVFDGTVSAVPCHATRIPMCVKGLHNPYDVCEDNPDDTGPVLHPGP